MAIGVQSKSASRARNRVFGIVLALLVIVAVSVLTAISAAETKKTITVVKIKSDTPLSANSRL